MGIDAISGLLFGKIYDKLKIQNKRKENYLLLLILLTGMFITLLIFSNFLVLIIFGVSLLGFVLGMQETIMKAVIADITPINKRSSGFGIFNLSLGLAFFFGSSLIGYLYDYSIKILVIVLIIIETLSCLFFLLTRRML